MLSSRPRTGQCIFCTFRRWHSPTAARSSRRESYSQTSNRTRKWQQGQHANGGGSGSVLIRYQSKSYGGRITNLAKAVLDCFDGIAPRLKSSPVLARLDSRELEMTIVKFRAYLHNSLRTEFTVLDRDSSLKEKFLDAFNEGGYQRVESELRHLLYNRVLGHNFSQIDITNQRSLADLRYPLEWYSRTRAIKRTIHAHIGPTNSGKTYHALKRLETARSGVYAGPLRLLAHEVYSRLNAAGKTCALVTGEEHRVPENWQTSEKKVVSCTVEMTNLSTAMDVAVIDEIQMLGSEDRGSAWTAALMAVQAPEVHVCGEVRTLPLIREIASSMGDELIVHEYKRLTTLQMDRRSLAGSFEKLQKGDCIVTFSVLNIHALRTEVEKKTGKNVAIIYGSLPPETRAQQARLFNDPDNDYDYLIASDAVGMGLNLSIKRVVFDSIRKWRNGKYAILTIPEIRQIAGRAGRYRSAYQAMKNSATDAEKTAQLADMAIRIEEDSLATAGVSTASDVAVPPTEVVDETSQHVAPTGVDEPASTRPNIEASMDGSIVSANIDITPGPRPPFDEETIGLVTTMEEDDFPIVRKALETEPPPIKHAYIMPPSTMVSRFVSYFPPSTPFSYILLRLKEISSTSSRYRIQYSDNDIWIADVIHDISNLTTDDRMILCNLPLSQRDANADKLVHEIAECIANQRGGGFLEISSLDLEILDQPRVGRKDRLKSLELLHKGIVAYLWVSFRFPGIFMQRPMANKAKEIVETEIEETLKLLKFQDSAARRKLEKQKMTRDQEAAAQLKEGTGEGMKEVPEVRSGEGFESAGDEIVGEAMPEDDEGSYPEQDLAELKKDESLNDLVLPDVGEGESPQKSASL